MVIYNMNRKTINSAIITIFLMVSVIASASLVAAEGPKAVYGTLYIDSGSGYEIAEDGIEVTIEIDGETFTSFTMLNSTSQINYGIGIPPGYEATTGYFKVDTEDYIPDDNISVIFNENSKYRVDLHVTIDTSGGGDEPSGGGGSPGGGYIPPSGGDDPSAGSSNRPPIANASGPYTGETNKEIKFDGSESFDPDDDPLTYVWDFGDGENASGILVAHTYTSTGTFTVTLTVSDGSLSDDDATEAVIAVGNSLPYDLVVTGPNSGDIDEELFFSATAYDSDTDAQIHYVFNWDDGSSVHITSNGASGETKTASHSWSSFGLYEMEIYAEDNRGGTSETQMLTVAIDVIVISGDINGYIGDEDNDDIYDIFMNTDTGVQTDVGITSDGDILIDSDGDGDWDYIYDIDTETLQEYTESSGMDFLWLYILIGIIAGALGILIFIIWKKRDKDEDQKGRKIL